MAGESRGVGSPGAAVVRGWVTGGRPALSQAVLFCAEVSAHMSSAQAPVLRSASPLVHLWTLAGICSDLTLYVVNGTMCNFSPRTGAAPQGQQDLEPDGNGELMGSLLGPRLGLETVILTQAYPGP